MWTFFAWGAFSQTEPHSALSPKFIGKHTGVEISKAQPEDITPQNYPNIIKSFVFPKAKLKDVIKAMSTDLNINIIMDPALGNQEISIISYSPITVAEAYQAFLSALAIHDLTVIRSGSFLKVVRTDTALRSNLRVYKGQKPINNDQFITSIIKLKNIDASSLETKIKPFIDAKAVKSLIFYPPSNTVIISDYGSNVEKLRKIIRSLDVPSQDFIFKVFPIKHARADTLTKIINKLLPTGKSSSRFSYRSRSIGKSSYGSKQFINISSLSSDERTNSVIAMGNQAGIKKVGDLIKKLDYHTDSELAGGIYVYKVKHGIAEELASTLNDLIGKSKSERGKESIPKVSVAGGRPSHPFGKDLQNVNTALAFQDVRVIAEKNTNSLLIVANKYNYDQILDILKKVDISRNQVFIKSIIMELSTGKSNNWQIANYWFPEDGEGLGRVGYGLNKLQDIGSTEGATLFFPLSIFLNRAGKTSDIGQWAQMNTGSNAKPTINVPDLSSFIQFLQKNVGGNILSTPQVMALDHQEASISIVEKIPVIGERTSNQSIANQFSTSYADKDVETSLTFTPHINPNVNSIRLEIEQKIDSLLQSSRVPAELQQTSIATRKRSIKTFITLKDRETAVLGGLIKETLERNEIKVPILGDLPLIGWLFKNSNNTKERSNLIVFITPHIVRSAEEHKHILSDKLKERLNFIRKFTGGEDDPYKDYTKQMKAGLTKDFSPPPPQEEELPYDWESAETESAQEEVYLDEDDLLPENP